MGCVMAILDSNGLRPSCCFPSNRDLTDEVSSRTFEEVAFDFSTSSQIELSIECANLISMDRFSLSDPVVVLFLRDSRGMFAEYGRTEAFEDNSNPKFVTSFKIPYENGFLDLLFRVYDIDYVTSDRLDDQQLIGEARVDIQSILKRRSNKIEMELHNDAIENEEIGRIIIYAEKVVHSNQLVTMTISGSNFRKPGWCELPNPYIIISRATGGSSNFTPVYRSPIRRRTSATIWPKVSISLQKICNCDMTRLILIEAMSSRNSNDTTDFKIGEAIFCFNDLKEGSSKLLQLVPQLDYANSSLLVPYLNSSQTSPVVANTVSSRPKTGHLGSAGSISLSNFSLRGIHSFLDFVKSGCDVKIVSAIDFSGSNVIPESSISNHYVHRSRSTTGGAITTEVSRDQDIAPNDYEMVIEALEDAFGGFCNQEIEAYGFGTVLPIRFNELGFYNEQEVDGSLILGEVDDQVLNIVDVDDSGGDREHHNASADRRVTDRRNNTLKNPSNVFALNGDNADPVVIGWDGVLESYRDVIIDHLSSIQLSGPTILHQVVLKACESAQKAHRINSDPLRKFESLQKLPLQYILLVILTDGCWQDDAKVITSIIYGSRLPLSIILVGVGDGEFQSFRRLRNENNLLVIRVNNDKKFTAVREIVQCIEYRKYKTQHPSKIMADVLHDIPRQLLDYFSMIGVSPGGGLACNVINRRTGRCCNQYPCIGLCGDDKRKLLTEAIRNNRVHGISLPKTTAGKEWSRESKNSFHARGSFSQSIETIQE